MKISPLRPVSQFDKLYNLLYIARNYQCTEVAAEMPKVAQQRTNSNFALNFKKYALKKIAEYKNVLLDD